MTREVSRENSQAAEDKDPRAIRPDQPRKKLSIRTGNPKAWRHLAKACNPNG